MEISDQEYLEYLRATGTWTEAEKLQWEYLSNIVKLLSSINDRLGMTAPPNMSFMGKPMTPKSGSPLAPKVARTDYSSRMAPPA